ncbi:hypothetical protein BCT84_07335 [Vibrio breoganii]|nr:hypothetical protein BCT84_07335 [Vibrio breoganii]
MVRFTYNTGVTNPVITYEDSEKPEWVTWSTWSGTRILQIRNQNAVVVPHVTAYLSWRHGSGSPPWSHYHFYVQRKGYQRGDGGCFWESYDWDEEVVVSGAVFNSPHYKTLTAPTADKGSSNAGFDYGMKLQNGSSLAYHKWYVDYEIVWDSYVPSPSTPNC